MVVWIEKLPGSVAKSQDRVVAGDEIIMTETILTYVILLAVLVLFYGVFWHNRSARELAQMEAETKSDEGLRPKRSS